MFGYVRPYQPEMKLAEYDAYRAIYCGLCREIGSRNGQIARLGLSYDIVLLCAVRMVLEEITPEFDEMRCPAHPMKKRSVLLPNPATEFTVGVFDVLVSAKVADDKKDEHGWKRLKPLLLSPLAAHLDHCAEHLLSPDVPKTVQTHLDSLSAFEKEKSKSVDFTSETFGEMLGYLFSLGLEGEKRRIAEEFGRSIGQFIYICDAADDLIDDKKRGRYNPLLLSWGDYALENGEISPLVREGVKTSLALSLQPLEKVAELLDRSHPFTPIIRNIIYLGFPASLERILSGKRRNEKTYQNKQKDKE